MSGTRDRQRVNTALVRKFRAFVERSAYPCLGAKAAFNADACELHCYPRLGESATSACLASDLYRFVAARSWQRSDFVTFIALFHEPVGISEREFEQCLWRTLQQLNRIDAARFEWDPTVHPDPRQATFAFSFAGRAFYIVGMHGNSSRRARRFPVPTLIFNAHEQFRTLRSKGKWELMKACIRKRDAALQGKPNPMLQDFGERSEARQYSGREVEEDWNPSFRAAQTERPHRCPFAH
jgi:FPC/CPF motif-containing protein YcgG